MSSAVVPDAWKVARVQPINKSGNKNKAANYRPISLLSIPSKILEKAIHMNWMGKGTSRDESRFRIEIG